MKTSTVPCRNAGHRQRQGDFSKGCHGRSAQIGGSFQKSAVKLFNGNINGEDHKRKKGVYHAQHDGAFIVQELDRLGNYFQLHQNRIQHALAAEDDHPRIGTDKEIDPERNHTEDQPFLPQTAGEPGDAVCQRIAHKDGTYRGHDGYENCPSENGNIKRIQKSCIVLESPVKNDLSVRRAGSERNRYHDEQGNDKENGQPDHGRQEQIFSVSFHRSTLTSSFSYHQMPTWSLICQRWTSSKYW